MKAPFSRPKSSLSSRPVGIAAQLSLTKGFERRGLRLWIARAINSFPVPVSPWISTVESVGATVSTSSSTLRSGALCPTISEKLISLRSSSLEEDFTPAGLVFNCSICRLRRNCLLDGV